MIARCTEGARDLPYKSPRYELNYFTTVYFSNAIARLDTNLSLSPKSMLALSTSTVFGFVNIDKNIGIATMVVGIKRYISIRFSQE